MARSIGPIQPGGRDIGPLQSDPGQFDESFSAAAGAGASFVAVVVLSFTAAASGAAALSGFNTDQNFVAAASAPATFSGGAAVNFTASAGASASFTAAVASSFTAAAEATAAFSTDRNFIAAASAEAEFVGVANAQSSFSTAASAAAFFVASKTVAGITWIPVIVIGDPGSGYITPPAVTINNVPGATAIAILGVGDHAGEVVGAVITCIGGEPTGTPSVTFAPGPGDDATGHVPIVNPVSQQAAQALPFKVVRDGYGLLSIETMFDPEAPAELFTNLMQPPINQPLLESSGLIAPPEEL